MSSSKRDFFKAFFTSRKMTGSVIPSSRFLTKKMLDSVDFKDAKCIIELGPGTGVITKQIVAQMQNDAQLVVIELNEDFIQNLNKKINDPRVHIIHDSAEQMKAHLNKYGCDSADYIISSLPLTTIPSEIRENILSTAHSTLKDDGEFIQFQYSLHQRKNLKSLFKKVDISYTPLNFPPAFVYRCKK